MRSTTGNQAIRHERTATPTQVAAAPDTRTLAAGLAVLQGLLAGRVPARIQDELCALQALRHLHERGHFDAALQARRDEISVRIEHMEPDAVHRILDAITRRPSLLDRMRGRGPRRIRRITLLFVLAARTLGPVNRFPIIPILSRLGYWGNLARLEDLLNWIAARWTSRSMARLARTYLELARDVLLPDQMLRQGLFDEAMLGDFMQLPWSRQLVQLQVWRRDWNLDAATDGDTMRENPTFDASRIEFHLALTGAFGSLRRRGGRVGRSILDELQYHDASSGSSSNTRERWLQTSLFIALSLVTWMFAFVLARSIDRSNLQLARAILAAYGAPPEVVR